MMKLGRNEKCPCGSGKKYKKCCGETQHKVSHLSCVENIQEFLQQGYQLHQSGLLEQAKEKYCSVLTINPNNDEALHLYGLIDHAQGDYKAAVKRIKKAITLSPETISYPYNLAEVLKESGEYEEAISYYQRALKIEKDSTDVLNNLGLTYFEIGKIEDAKICFQRILKLQPNSVDALNNLGIAYQTQGKLDEAISLYEKLILIQTDYIDAYVNLGLAQYKKGLIDRAIQTYLKALEFEPASVSIKTNLALALQGQGRIDDAIKLYRDILSENNDPVIHSNYLMALHYSLTVSPQELYAEHLNYAKRYTAKIKSNFSFKKKNKKRLRVGYLSPDLRNHAVAYFSETLIENHDHNKYEIYAYYNNQVIDNVTERIKKSVQCWRNISGILDKDVAKLIFQDEIDILIDLAGHTAGNRLLVFAYKPAPIQVSWLGYGDTTGLSTIDYRVTDPLTNPIGKDDQYYTETLTHLPETFCCFRPPINSPDVNPLPAIHNEYITFASFNNLAKINSKVIELWAKVLKSVPNSRLMLKANGLNETETQQRIVQLFLEHEIDASRLILEGREQNFELRYHEADIALDPFPWNGGTTSFHTLWMGVPVISLTGTCFLGRMGASLLKNIGLDCFIATSENEYVDIAVKTASNLNYLSGLRRELRSRMEQSSLVSGIRFAKNMEQKYSDMWLAWCNSEN